MPHRRCEYASAPDGFDGTRSASSAIRWTVTFGGKIVAHIWSGAYPDDFGGPCLYAKVAWTGGELVFLVGDDYQRCDTVVAEAARALRSEIKYRDRPERAKAYATFIATLRADGGEVKFPERLAAAGFGVSRRD